MKLNIICRDDEEFTRSTNKEQKRFFSTPDPTMHKFEKAREYVRAVNAAKYDSMFARPFVADMSAHRDTPSQIDIHKETLGSIISAGYDGDVVVWDVTNRKVQYKIQFAHNGIVSGLTVHPAGRLFYTCGIDKYVKAWKLDVNLHEDAAPTKPLQIKSGEEGYLCVDHHEKESILATGSDSLELWDSNRLVVKSSHEYADHVTSCRFNRTETNLLAVSTRDRMVSLFDIRANSVASKFLMKRKTNSICWNPMQPFVFTLGNEDYNCYTFDIRMLEKGPKIMHVGHINAVLSIDYAPTGLEFVSGSYDTTIRIFKTDSTDYKSRATYYTKRMRRVFCVKYSGDSKYIYSGSDDHAIRIWKSNASELARPLSLTEKARFNYQDQLLQRYGEMEEVKEIASKQRLPKKIYNLRKDMLKEMSAVKEKEHREKRYSRKRALQVLDKIKKSERMRNFLGTRE